MRVIVAQAKSKYNQGWGCSQEIQKFVRSHRFFVPEMEVGELCGRIVDGIKKSKGGNRSQIREQALVNDTRNGKHQQGKQEQLSQLELYYNRQNNKQIFALFQAVLGRSAGCSYQMLGRLLKTDIITVSHYCCKLKKLRLIDWKHQKQGVIVFPRQKGRPEPIYQPNHNQTSYDMDKSFVFRELSMCENIWVNVSGEQSVRSGGITNEEIKRKIMKQAENKMVRRTVQGMRYFDRRAQRQGKVFEFKYVNETVQLKSYRERGKRGLQQDTQYVPLEHIIQAWLQQRFPQLQGPRLLLNLINTRFTQYISSVGIKQSKRECTPLKLNRYVRVLNYLQIQGGMRESQLRALIVRDEEQYNMGVMHKRSLLGILQSLKSMGIVEEDAQIYYAGWQNTRKVRPVQPKMKRYEMQGQNQRTNGINGRKMVHLDKTAHKTKHQIPQETYRKVSQRSYRLQIYCALLNVTLDKAIKWSYRKAFNRIVYVQRKKNIAIFTPQAHVLDLLQKKQAPKLNFYGTPASFYQQLDAQIQERAQVNEIGCQVQNDIVRYLRRNPIKNSASLRIKYGKSWSAKFMGLQSEGLVRVDQQGISLTSNNFLI